jgi:hypothetical protein
LLADDETSLWVASYFDSVAPLPEAEVGRVVAMLRRGMTAFAGPPRPPTPQAVGPVAISAPATAGGAGGGGGQRGVAGLSPAAATAAKLRYAAVLQRRFPKHPDVAAFFEEFPRVAQEIAGSPPSRVNRG